MIFTRRPIIPCHLKIAVVFGLVCPGKLKRRLASLRIRRWPAEAIGPVIPFEFSADSHFSAITYQRDRRRPRLPNSRMLGLSSDRSPQENLPEKVLPDFQGLDGSYLVKHELLEWVAGQVERFKPNLVEIGDDLGVS